MRGHGGKPLRQQIAEDSLEFRCGALAKAWTVLGSRVRSLEKLSVPFMRSWVDAPSSKRPTVEKS